MHIPICYKFKFFQSRLLCFLKRILQEGEAIRGETQTPKKQSSNMTLGIEINKNREEVNERRDLNNL
jgi:hypothetical protein